MKSKRFLSLFVCLLMTFMLAGCGSEAEPAQEQPAVNEAVQEDQQDQQAAVDLMITAQEALALMADDNVIFLDCTDSAEKGTVKGAVATSWQELCTCSDEYGQAGDDDWGKIPEAADLAGRLGALGLDKNKEIVALGHTLDGWGEDARIAWELRAAGYENVKIVDGGIDAMFDAGAEKQSGGSEPVPCEVIVDSIDNTHVMDTEELVNNFDQYKIVDVRTEKEYNGATKYGEARGGHIKGAVLIPYLDLFESDGTLKPLSEITEMYEAQGIARTDKVVTYCTGGIRSAYAQMVLEMCGFENTYNYDQSYWNWCIEGEIE